MQLNDALAELNQKLAEESASPRPWWEAMNDEGLGNA